MDFVQQCSRWGWIVPDHLIAGLHCAEATDLAASFVLGALEPAEADAVRTHIGTCPEPHAEFAEVGSVVPALWDAVDIVQPPATLRARILGAAAAEMPSVAATPVAQARLAIDVPRLADTQRSGARRSDTQRSGWAQSVFSRPIWAAVAIAAALGVVALGAWNLQLRNEINGLDTYRNGVATVLDAAAQPGAQLATLTAANGAEGPSGLAAVAEDGSITLVMGDLNATSGAQVYEAWLISGTANPVPIGGFHVGADGAAVFAAQHAPLGAGVTVALTLEPGPGATTPTAPVIAAGKAAAQAS